MSTATRSMCFWVCCSSPLYVSGLCPQVEASLTPCGSVYLTRSVWTVLRLFKLCHVIIPVFQCLHMHVHVGPACWRNGRRSTNPSLLSSAVWTRLLTDLQNWIDSWRSILATLPMTHSWRTWSFCVRKRKPCVKSRRHWRYVYVE